MSAQNGHSQTEVLPHFTHSAAMIASAAPRQLQKDELAGWIVEKANPDNGREQCMLFSLTHDSDRGPVPITQEIIAKNVGEHDRERLANKIVNVFATASRNIADGAGSTTIQRFIVGAHVKNHKDEHALFQYVFVVTPPPEIAAAAAEQTGMTGIIGHLQRFSGDIIKMWATTMQEDKERLVSENKSLRERLDAIELRSFQQREKNEELLDASSLRNIQALKIQQEMELQTKGMLMAFELGGALVKKHLNLETQRNPMLDFVRTLEPVQFAQFYASLTDEQREAFSPMLPQVLDSLPEEKRAELVQFFSQLTAEGAAASEGGDK